MSRFFRSDDSSSSSSSDRLDDDEGEASSRDLSRVESFAVDSNDSQSAAVALSAPTLGLTGAQHKDVLLHALLEERCMNEARKEFSGRNASKAEIETAARQKYRRLCSNLAPYGLVAAGLEQDAHRGVRQRYRDGLDLLSENTKIEPSTTKGAIRPLNKRLISNGTTEKMIPRGLEALQLTDTSANSSPALSALASAQSFFDASRYERDFEELGVLGKGGYGVVYHCRHRLDGCAYAVKKVPLSISRLRKIQTRGQAEVDELLRELTTLAQLEHPNVVRYFGGWIEWTPGSFGSPITSSDHRDAVLGANNFGSNESLSLGRIVTDSGEDNIMFGSSASRNMDGSTGDDNFTQHTDTRGTQPIVSDDDDVESISRSYEPTSSFLSQSTSNATPMGNGQPCLALHIQMALYPMTLADFLTTDTQPVTPVAPLKHCFHTKPSMNILLAVLDGVTYLHHHGIVHRDIKPGNIFLGLKQDPRKLDGSVDLFLCDDCRASGKANPVALNVRIGDFGLVTAIAKPETEDAVAGASPVGTALYQPTSVVPNASPALDIYALGIVAFELLWPFGTRMERLETLQSLKQGYFPLRFSERIGDTTGGIETCIKAMLASDTHNETSMDEIRGRILELC